MTLLVLLQ